MDKKALISALNSLGVGEFSRIRSRLDEVRAQVGEQGWSEISQILDEAKLLLDGFDLKGFRKKVQHAVSRLGHVKDGKPSLAGKLPDHLKKS